MSVARTIDYRQLGRLMGRQERLDKGLGLALQLGSGGMDYRPAEQARLRAEQDQVANQRQMLARLDAARAERAQREEQMRAEAQAEKVEGRRYAEDRWREEQARLDARQAAALAAISGRQERGIAAREAAPSYVEKVTELKRRDIEDRLREDRLRYETAEPEQGGTFGIDEELAQRVKFPPSERAKKEQAAGAKATQDRIEREQRQRDREARLRLAEESAKRAIEAAGRAKETHAERVTRIDRENRERQRQRELDQAIASRRVQEQHRNILNAWEDSIRAIQDNPLNLNKSPKEVIDKAEEHYRAAHPGWAVPWEVPELAPESPGGKPGPGGKGRTFGMRGAGGTVEDTNEVSSPTPRPFGLPETFIRDETTSRVVTPENVRGPTRIAIDKLKAKHPAAAKIALNEMRADPGKFADMGVNVEAVFAALGE